MSLEQQLQEHFNRSGAQLTEPQERLGEVVKRGRRRRVAQGGMALAAVAALAFTVPTLLSSLDGSRVDFEGAPATQPAEDPTTKKGAIESATEQLGISGDDGFTVGVMDLGAPAVGFKGREVIGYEDPEGPDLHSKAFSGTVPFRILNVIPDGRRGVVVQGENVVQWFPRFDGNHITVGPTLVESEESPLARTMLPDGRLLYSTRPDFEDPEMAVEQFFAIELAEGAQPELVESAAAHESWIEGPVTTTDGSLAHGACHLMCTLYPGMANEPKGSQPLYHGGGGKQGTTASISGLTATPDGKVLAFVESNPAFPESERHPHVLVLLDGSSCETLARIQLRSLNAKADWGPAPVVSISADGQRVLVTRMPADKAHSMPGQLIEGALTAQPQIRTILHMGPLRWLDPEAANQ